MYKLTTFLICVLLSIMTIASAITPDLYISTENNNNIVSNEDHSNIDYCEVELLSVLVIAEADGEPELGKRLVIDTVLNRVDSKNFPNTIYDVIFQENQFTSVKNGRLDQCHIDADICNMIIEEIKNRTNYKCVYFNANNYSEFGKPMFKIGNHYFSSEGDV